MKAFTFKMDFYADSEMIESISDQLIGAGFKPTERLIKKVIRDKTHLAGDAFIVEPTLYDRFDEDETDLFIRSYRDLGFKLKNKK